MGDFLYLYGTNEVPEVPEDIIMRRVILLEDHLDGLLEVNYFERDTVRINKIMKLIELLKTING